jgi:hypothetical protein
MPNIVDNQARNNHGGGGVEDGPVDENAGF